MANNTKKLSDEAPIILTWVPRVYGASLPDGKNSSLNYDDLKHELQGIKGVHVVDLHQYDWSKIDTGWKIDGKDISIKSFFKHMYNMTDEQRTYFAIEIDTFRLTALALLKQFTKHEGGIL
ncbi:hypothetical protein [Wolbachia endosymbiont of Madathamugadia hiepei]|uniref:hypothetical protein n=1 Tax=Wolbachia endosymbiont of Madathamugadia hiepei TaxID=1241303 RepID=UPI001FE73FFD|nr:hypothetical protein [Wolbachia endosymbiont of Madathamugadia hiepei]